MVLLLCAELPIFHFPLVSQPCLNYASFHCWQVLRTLKAALRSRREAEFALLQTLIRLISEVKLWYFSPLQATHTQLSVQENFGEGINTVAWEGCQGAAPGGVWMRWSLKYTWKCLCQERLRKLQLITDYKRWINGNETLSWARPWQLFPFPWKAGSLLTHSVETQIGKKRGKTTGHQIWLVGIHWSFSVQFRDFSLKIYLTKMKTHKKQLMNHLLLKHKGVC